MLILAILVVLLWHVSRSFDVRTLGREVMIAALATLTILVFWNCDAWVAHANLDRYARRPMMRGESSCYEWNVRRSSARSALAVVATTTGTNSR